MGNENIHQGSRQGDSPHIHTIQNAQRVLLKLSGEALMGNQSYGIDPQTVEQIASDISQVVTSGKQICVVIGGGNIFRGINGFEMGIERVSADNMGMLATVMNAIALQSALEKHNIITRVQSAIHMHSVCESYIRRRAIRHMEKGRVVIFAAGSGNPFFTTDTAAALRASEMGCDLLLKGTKVDGIYAEDPMKNPDAQKFSTLSYRDVLNKDLKVMDAAAISLTRENHIPIVVFSICQQGNLPHILNGNGEFTFVSD